jgi:hypothetical protein
VPQLDAAERFADGKIERKAMKMIRQPSGGPYNVFLEPCRVSRFSIAVVLATLRAFQQEFEVPSERELCDLSREVINPFHPTPLLPSLLNWNDGTVPKIAQGIYEGRAFDRLPILHDALLDAGCDDENILAHCRSEGPHVRGCWVIDLILGKQ